MFFGEVSTESLFHCSISVCGPSPTYNSTSLSGPWPSQNFILFSRGLTIVLGSLSILRWKLYVASVEKYENARLKFGTVDVY